MPKKTKTIITPKGRLLYPHLLTPDTKFDDDGVYKTDLILDHPDEIDVLRGDIEEFYEEAYAEDNARHGGKKSLAKHPDGFPLKVDEDPVVLKTKQRAVIRYNGTASRIRPKILDAKLNPCAPESIGNDTVARLKIELSPWVASGKFGVTARLKAVQILELVEYDSDADGFEAEDGYVAPEVAPAGSDTAPEVDPDFDSEDGPNF